MAENTNVAAVRSGVITEVGYSDFNGNYIRYETDDGFTVLYAHLNKALAEKGQKIKQGDIIALSGNTGRSTGPHVHYSVWKGDMLINPMQFVELSHAEEVTKEYAQRGVAIKR